jgi:hypothetical protein
VLGSGEAIAILDAEGIKRLAGVEGSPRGEPRAGEPERAAEQAIVFNGGGEGLFAVDAKAVSRIERISPAAIRQIGADQFVEISGRTVAALRAEDYAPVEKSDYTSEWAHLVALGGDSPQAGFLAQKVLDQVSGAYAKASGNIGGDYVLGAGEYEKKEVIYLDAAAILRSLDGRAAGPGKDGDGNDGAKLLRGRRMVRRRHRGGEQGGA